ncbi:MAG: methyl-accepting chemotaxis protein [Deltaproteobacteria bacterium]|nr:methyl-accepting chemotaxis protein [Deltaproteobacteria bacterium]
MKNLTLSLKIVLSFSLVLLATLVIILMAVMALKDAGKEAESARAQAFELGFRTGQVIGVGSQFPRASESVFADYLRSDSRPDNDSLTGRAGQTYGFLVQSQAELETLTAQRANAAAGFRSNSLAWAEQLGRSAKSETFYDLVVMGLGLMEQDSLDSRAFDQWLSSLRGGEDNLRRQSDGYAGLPDLKGPATDFGEKSRLIEEQRKKILVYDHGLLKEIQGHKADSGLAVRNVAFSLGLGFLGLAVLTALLVLYIFRTVIKPLRQILGSLEQSAGEVTGTVRLLSGSSKSLAKGASDNTRAVLAAISSLEDLLNMAKRNAGHSDQAKELMDKAKSFVAEANAAMGQISLAMEEIKSSGQASSQIVKSVEEIAFQTNILALNAAVEAARAGEAGVGFAVVADEVRNLANSSSEAAKNTTSMLAGSIRRINDGAQLVSQAEASFVSLVATSDEVAELVDNITQASQSQARAIQDVHQSIAMMDKVTQENAVEAADTENISQALNSQATLLNRTIRKIASILHGWSIGWQPAKGQESKKARVTSLSAIKEKEPAPKPMIQSKKVSQKALDNVLPMDDDF